MAWGLVLAGLLGLTTPDWVPTPDDDRWMRGLFAGASAEDRDAFARINDLLDQCRKTATTRVRAELAAMGETAPALPEQSYGSEPCSSATMLMPMQKFWGDWDIWLAANAEAKRLFAAFDYGVGSRLEPTTPDGAKPGLATQLNEAVVREQAYRRGLSWPNEGPPVDAIVWAALMRRIWRAATIEDHKNTAMLKAIVAEHGWPTIQLVGAQASLNAWLIVQHADDDPAFQLRVLRLMAPLAATGAVSKSNYAFLYDRVMINLAGKQRYGTQTRCLNGAHVALPMEAPERVDTLRAEMGLDTLGDNLARIGRLYGPCPAA